MRHIRFLEMSTAKPLVFASEGNLFRRIKTRTVHLEINNVSFLLSFTLVNQETVFE